MLHPGPQILRQLFKRSQAKIVLSMQRLFFLPSLPGLPHTFPPRRWSVCGGQRRGDGYQHSPRLADSGRTRVQSAVLYYGDNPLRDWCILALKAVIDSRMDGIVLLRVGLYGTV